MSREEIFEKLNNIFRTNFDDDSITVDENTTADDIEDWDSLEQINLIVAINKEFNIKMSLEESVKAKNVGAMADIIEREIAG